MKQTIPNEYLPSALELLRKAGYSPFTDPKSGEDSYILRLTSEYYPRFHLYVKETQTEIELSLHIDQKKPGYKGAHRHNGEYEGPLVEREMQRILDWANNISGGRLKTNKKTAVQSKNEPNKPDKKNLFGGIF
ncbi:hypothetical protein KJ766_02895 [Patescibacteria group bacterium]|nr:hypothetical protein [Patescibacteria group bacterium]